MTTAELILAANALPVSSDRSYFIVSGYLDGSFSVSDRTHFHYSEIISVSKAELPTQILINRNERMKGSIEWKIGINVWKESNGSINYQAFIMPDYGHLHNGNMASENGKWVGVSAANQINQNYASVQANVPEAPHLTCRVQPVDIAINSNVPKPPTVEINNTGFSSASSIKSSTSNHNENEEVTTISLTLDSSISANFSSEIGFAFSNSQFSSSEESSSESSSTSESVSITVKDVFSFGGSSSDSEESTTTIVASSSSEQSVSQSISESMELTYSNTAEVTQNITVSPKKRVDCSIVILSLKSASYPISFGVGLSGKINGVQLTEQQLKIIAEQLYHSVVYATPSYATNKLILEASGIVTINRGSSLAVNVIIGAPVSIS